MKTQKTLFVILLMLIIHPTLTFGQIYAPEGLNMPGGWDGWSNPPTNPVFAGEAQSDHGELKLVELGLTAMYQTTFEVAADGDVAAGDYEFKFTSGPTNNYWANGWGSVNVISNTLQEYQLSGGNNSITLTDQKWYVMNWENKGYENTKAIFMELENQPAGFLSVSHTPEVPDPLEQITFSVETDIEPGTAQNVYVRYTDDDWTTSSLEEVSFTGTSGEATLAGFPVNSTIEYYVFSTNQETPIDDIDLKTIHFDNNSGDNYTIAVSDEYTVTFSVTDGNSPVEGATVDVNDTQLTSDASGEATINLLNGDYPYTVMADGFVNATGTVTVNGSDVTEDVVLEQAYDVSFNVDMSKVAGEDFDPATDAVYLSGSMFDWPEPGTDSNLEMTDPDDDMIYTLEAALAVGDYQYKHFILPEGNGSSWEYGEWDGNNREFTMSDAPVALDNIFGHFVTEFQVINESDDNIEGATVEVNGEAANTDASGLASFHLPPNDWDGYDYEVSAEGFSNALGNIIVPYQDVEEEVTLTEPTSFMVTFQVSDGDSPVEGALISIDGNELTSDADGEASVELDNGNYDYSVTADGFMDNQGSLTVDGSEVTEEVVLSEGHMVTFNVDMSEFGDFDPVNDGVYVTGTPFGWTEPGQNDDFMLQDPDEDLVYSLEKEVAVGEHDYKYFYIPDGYTGSGWDNGEWDGETDRSFSVTDAPLILNDIWGAFIAEFHVINESDENIEGATVEVNGESANTDASGLASFHLPPNDWDGYDYEVSAEGYSTALGNIMVPYQDVEEEVTLTEPTSFMVTFQVSDGDNPVEGALISIDGNELTSDADGEASIELDNGNYDYTVTADGFMDHEGSLTVDGSEVIEEVTLTVGHLVTFNVDMSEFVDFDPVNDAVYVTGTPFGWTEPGQNEDFMLQDPDEDLVYSLEKEVAVGEHDYKYFYIPDGYTGSGWDNGEWDGETDRSFTVTDAPLILNDIWGAFIAEFHVINESDENIEGATVEVNGESANTDASGLASFHLPPNDWDGYDYEVSAEGYSTALGNIMVPYQDVEKEVTLTEPSTFTVTFSVTDGTDPVEGATISINSTELTTGAAGEATIDLDNGSYPYTVSADGFMDATGEVVVNGSDVTEEVTLSIGSLVTFNLDMADFAASSDFDPATDEVYISGSPFGWPEPGTNASLQLTDPDDDLVYTLETEVAAGSHEYKYFYVPGGTGSSWDYGEWGSEDNRTLEVTDSEIITDDVWGAFYVEFHVSNAADEDIEGATVSVEGEELTTNADGIAETTLPPDGATTYSYEVSASGYATATGTVLVDFTDVFEEVTLFEPDAFMVNFFVDMSPAVESGEFNPDADAVYVSGSAFGWPEPGTDGELELLDPDGDMIYGLNQEIAVGNYEYKYFIVPEGAGSSWDYGEWDGEVNRTFDVTDDDLVLNDFWGNFEVEFHVSNTGGDDIEGATIVFNDEELLTDNSGVASTIAPPNTGEGYDYEVYAEGYANAFGNITVNYEDVLEEVVMTEPASYTVTFEVSDGDSPVEGAVIDINGDQLTTDASGIAAIDLPNGNYPYTVTSDDFLTYEGEVTVNGADLTEEVILFTGYPVSFNVDMTPALENTDFDPEADAVYVSGSLFDWPQPGSVTDLQLTDTDGDLIYTLDTIAETGTHEYKYFYVPEGAGSSWDYGEWQGGDNRSVEVDDEGLDLNDIWGNFTVEFHVVNESDQNIEGAMVNIAGQELTTDNNGMASTYLTPDATEGYDYEVSATEYLPASGSVLVDYQDIMEEVVLEAENTYNVTFVVSDGDSPIADAAVMLEGYGEQMTDAAGETVYSDVAPSDSIYFSVNTDDYLFYEDSVAVADQNITENVTLIPTSLSSEVFKELKVYPNPVKEVLFIESHKNNIDLHIFNGNGKLVDKSVINGDESIPFHDKNAGVYILKFVADEKVKTIRIIKP